jgi:hypothetical protein
MAERQWRRTVDMSTQGIQLARQAHPDITFIEADATGDLKSLIGKARSISSSAPKRWSM